MEKDMTETQLLKRTSVEILTCIERSMSEQRNFYMEKMEEYNRTISAKFGIPSGELKKEWIFVLYGGSIGGPYTQNIKKDGVRGTTSSPVIKNRRSKTLSTSGSYSSLFDECITPITRSKEERMMRVLSDRYNGTLIPTIPSENCLSRSVSTDSTISCLEY